MFTVVQLLYSYDVLLLIELLLLATTAVLLVVDVYR